MEVIDWKYFVHHGIKRDLPASFTTGVFDGVHRGHHQLIDCLTSIDGNMPVVATFRTNPFRLLRPENYQGDISTIDQKIELLGALGCEIIILIDFSLEFSKLSGRDFFSIIRRHIDLGHLVLGKDHKLGNMGDTSAVQAKEMLEKEGVIVDIVEPLIDSGKPVSSTRIRIAVENGDFETVCRLLGRTHELDISRCSFSFEDNSPFIRRNDIKQVIPFSGRYAVTLESNEKTFATEINFFEDRIVFENKPDFQVETLKFSCLTQE